MNLPENNNDNIRPASTAAPITTGAPDGVRVAPGDKLKAGFAKAESIPYGPFEFKDTRPDTPPEPQGPTYREELLAKGEARLTDDGRLVTDRRPETDVDHMGEQPYFNEMAAAVNAAQPVTPPEVVAANMAAALEREAKAREKKRLHLPEPGTDNERFIAPAAEGTAEGDAADDEADVPGDEAAAEDDETADDGQTKAIDRLFLFMAHAELRPSQLERLTGLSNGYLAIQRKRRADMGEGVLGRVLKSFKELSPQWLLTGEGEMMRPVYTVVEADAGEGAPFFDVDFLCGFEELVNCQTSTPSGRIVGALGDADVYCTVTGDSMYPTICSGDVIGLRFCELSDVQFGEIYACVMDDFRTVKVLRRGSRKNTYRFVPINSEHFDEQEFPAERILRVFKVVGMGRRN